MQKITSERLVLRRGEDGASAVEYALIISLIAVVIIVAITLLGGELAASLANDCTQVASATGTGTC